MTYDMSLFTTIASASASFVAIIGGFVTSKLISVNGERSAVIERITELGEMLKLKEDHADEITEYLNRDDALEFIRHHIDALAGNANLSNIFETDKPQCLDMEVLRPYWERGLELNKQFRSLIEKPCETNEDDIPIELALATMDNSFDYEICEMLSKNEIGGLWAVTRGLNATETAVEQYNKRFEEREGIFREIAALELQMEQLERQKKALVQPEKMMEGLKIFGGISLINIFLPLLLTLILPHCPSAVYIIAQYVCVLTMGIGLVLTLRYMWTLLKWKPAENHE